MRERAFLRLGQIVQHGPGGADRLGVGRGVAETEAFQAGRAEMLGQHSAGPSAGEKAQAGRRVTIICSSSCAGQRRPPRRQQAFGRGDPRQLVGRVAGRETGRQEAARRKLDPRQPHRVARRHGRQEIALARIQQGIVGDGAGRDDPRHLAADQPFGQLGVFDLFADGRPHPGGDQLAQVAFQLVIGKAGHGDGVFALLAAGQRQIEHAGGRLGVVVEHLVEVAHAKQQQRVGTRPLRFLILLHHGGDGHAAMLTTEGGRGKGRA